MLNSGLVEGRTLFLKTRLAIEAGDAALGMHYRFTVTKHACQSHEGVKHGAADPMRTPALQHRHAADAAIRIQAPRADGYPPQVTRQHMATERIAPVPLEVCGDALFLNEHRAANGMGGGQVPRQACLGDRIRRFSRCPQRARACWEAFPV